MKRKKLLIAIALLISLMLVLTIIFIKQKQFSVAVKHEYVSVNEINDGYLSENITNSGSTLIVEAPITLNNVKSAENVKLVFYDEGLTNILKDQISTRNLNIEKKQENGTTYWNCINYDHLVLGFSADDLGYVGYIDSERDINSGLSELDKLLEEGYITSLVPQNMNCTAADAAAQVVSFYNKYSNLSYRVYNVLSSDNTNDTAKSGYYYVSLQGLYNDIPIMIPQNTLEERTIRGNACISNQGIFSYQGALLLTKESSNQINNIVTPESIIENLGKNFTKLFSGNNVCVYKIDFEYMSKEHRNSSSWDLKPVWVLYCEEKLSADETHENRLRKLAYYAESGKFAGIFD